MLQAPELIEIGRVRAVYWPGDGAAAAAYAEMADRATTWPGLVEPVGHPVRLIVVPDQSRFDSVTRGRLPEWGAGAAFPATNTIVVHAAWDGGRVLRHELAHLALRHRVQFAPRWFDEGYASRAAGEWSRLEWLRMNWALAAGRPPSLPAVNRELYGGRTGATQAYAFATSAVLLLERLGGDRGLEPLLTNLSANPDFDAALRATYGLSLGQFEARWHADLKRRYGWLSLATSFSMFWLLVAGAVVAVWYRRRRRDRARRLALDDGWIIPDEPPSQT